MYTFQEERITNLPLISINKVNHKTVNYYDISLIIYESPSSTNPYMGTTNDYLSGTYLEDHSSLYYPSVVHSYPFYYRISGPTGLYGTDEVDHYDPLFDYYCLDDLGILYSKEGILLSSCTDGEMSYDGREFFSSNSGLHLKKGVKTFDLFTKDNIGLSANNLKAIEINTDNTIWASVKMPDGTYRINEIKILPLKGKVYYDLDNSGDFTSGDKLINNQTINTTLSSLVSSTSSIGEYMINIIAGDSVKLSSIPTGWKITTPSTGSYHYSSIPSTTVTNADFALQIDEVLANVNTNITHGTTRCGFEVPYTLHYKNIGTEIVGGELVFEYDTSKLTILESTPMYTSSDPSGILRYTIADLDLFEEGKISLKTQVAGVEMMGEYINAITTFNTSKTDADLTDNTFLAKSEITCAYDPNDKQVLPLGVLDEGYTLFDDAETLEYTIQFQNTGNDTAFNIVVTDTIDTTTLDLTTFEFVVASHPVEYHFENNLIKFHFNNILLPDSTTNLFGSNGHFKFKIKTKKGLVENTEIKNKAYIYFDFNPPIITNEILTTLVNELPNSLKDNEEIDCSLFPNPTNDNLTINIANVYSDKVQIRIVSSLGQLMQEQTLQTNGSEFSKEIRVGELPNGVYLLHIKTDSGEITKTFIKQ